MIVFARILVSLIALLPLWGWAQSSLLTCPESGEKQNCYGTQIFHGSGKKYYGEFRDNKFNGQGVLTWNDGRRYFGGFRDGEFSGQGTFTYQDGRKYVGEYVAGFSTGLGIEYNSYGAVVRSGFWKNDQLIQSRTLDVRMFPFNSSNLRADSRNAPSNEWLAEQSTLKYQEKFDALEAAGPKNLPWKDRLDRYVQNELKQWLTPPAKGLEEIPAPTFPAALSLKQEPWETNKEFEDRVEKARNDRRLTIERIQADYKKRVDARNQNVAAYNKIRQEREAGLADRRRELINGALEALNPSVSLSEVAFDQQSGALTVSAQVDGLSKQTFAFTGTPQEFRRAALTSPASMRAKPVFQISNLGDITLQAINVEVGGTSARGAPSSGVSAPVQLATVNLPTVAAPTLTQQSGVAVDRNQVEQILYRDENEMLRKRLEEQRKQQEQAVASEQSKANAEITRLRAEADALRKQSAETRPVMNVATVRQAHALVIGTSAYAGSSRLPNPVNDSKAISNKLRSLGFQVTEVTDSTRDQMVKGLADFSNTASNSDLTLLFYAGHGVQIAGTNYMIPVDMNLNDVSQATLKAVSLNSVVEQYLPGKTKLVFLDACRDNPLMASVGRGVSKGLAPINVSEGTLIAYATKDGQTAEDGVDGRNSPFTSALLEHLSDPDDIAVVLRTVRSKVMQRTGNRQQPWEYGSLTGGALVLSAIQSTALKTSNVSEPAKPTPAATAPSAQPLNSLFRTLRDLVKAD